MGKDDVIQKTTPFMQDKDAVTTDHLRIQINMAYKVCNFR